MMNLNENRVREYAYFIWESEGKPHGKDQTHWQKACELAAIEARQADAAKPTPIPAESKPASKAKTVKARKADGNGADGAAKPKKTAKKTGANVITDDTPLITSGAEMELPEDVKKAKATKKTTRKTPTL